MSSRNVALLVAYDGTEYSGWQIQKNERTVQGVLEDALEQLHEKPVRINAAGRTDSGVHANGQVVNFFSDSSIPDDRFHHALNTKLPRDIRVLGSKRVIDDFHARFSAKWREYKFFLYPSEVSDPFSYRYCLTIKRKLDIAQLNRYASLLIGTHDFTTFSAVGDQSNSAVRDVCSSVFYIEGPYVIFRIVGNAFLWKMVRSLVGTILTLVDNGLPPEHFGEILRACDRSLAGTTAPAKALTLFKVKYNER